MINLLVMSNIKMSEDDLYRYAESLSNRTHGLLPSEFIEKIKKGERVVVQYPDGTITSYELIVEAN